MTDKDGIPAGSSNGDGRAIANRRNVAGARSVHKAQAPRGRSIDTLGLIRENESSAGYGQVPVWMAALFTSGCRATAVDSDRRVQWHCINGRAQYTNDASGALLIQPLGIRLETGQTLAASWTPGETDYTFEVLQQHDRYA